uniref:Uncharacterized protein n=1 Tax=Trichogramma kaykai TaxID=54128 RepID=A0ABD2XFS1_9HYME
MTCRGVSYNTSQTTPLPPSRPNYFTSIIYNGICAWIYTHIYIVVRSARGIVCACPRNHVKPIVVRLFFRPTGILALLFYIYATLYRISLLYSRSRRRRRRRRSVKAPADTRDVQTNANAKAASGRAI